MLNDNNYDLMEDGVYVMCGASGASFTYIIKVLISSQKR